MWSKVIQYGAKAFGNIGKSLRTNYLNPLKKSFNKMTSGKTVGQKIAGGFDTLMNATMPYYNAVPKITKSKLGRGAIYTGMVGAEVAPVAYGTYKAMKGEDEEDFSENKNFSILNPLSPINKANVALDQDFLHGHILSTGPKTKKFMKDLKEANPLTFSENKNFGFTGSVGGTVIGGAIGAPLGPVGSAVGAAVGGLGLSMLQDYQENRKKKKIIKEYLEKNAQQFSENNRNFDLAQDMDNATVKVDTNTKEVQKIQDLNNENKRLDNMNKTTAVLEGAKAASRAGMEKNISKSQGEDKQTRSIIKNINKNDGKVSGNQAINEAIIAGETNKSIRDNISKMQNNKQQINNIKNTIAKSNAANKNTGPITKNPGTVNVNINKGPITENPGTGVNTNVSNPANNTNNGKGFLQKLTNTSIAAQSAISKGISKGVKNATNALPKMNQNPVKTLADTAVNTQSAINDYSKNIKNNNSNVNKLSDLSALLATSSGIIKSKKKYANGLVGYSENNQKDNSKQNDKDQGLIKNLTDISVKAEPKVKDFIDKSDQKVKEYRDKAIKTVGKAYTTTAAAGVGLMTGGLPGAALGALGATQGEDLKSSVMYGTAGIVGGSILNHYRKKKKHPLLYR